MDGGIVLADIIDEIQREMDKVGTILKSIDRRLAALEQVAFGDGKPKKKGKA